MLPQITCYASSSGLPGIYDWKVVHMHVLIKIYDFAIVLRSPSNPLSLSHADTKSVQGEEINLRLNKIKYNCYVARCASPFTK
jgi:hypothetical protein